MTTTFDVNRITTAVDKARRIQERYGKELHVFAWKTSKDKTVTLISHTSTPPRFMLLNFPPVGEIKEYQV